MPTHNLQDMADRLCARGQHAYPLHGGACVNCGAGRLGAAATSQGTHGANTRQVGGTHYKAGIECWDFIAANNIGYFEGTAIKYLTRWRKKGGVEDLRKAVHFVEKLIELETGNAKD